MAFGSIWNSAVSAIGRVIKAGDEVVDDVAPRVEAAWNATKGFRGAAAHVADEVADFGFHAGSKGVRFAGGVANALGSVERIGAPAGTKVIKGLTSARSVTALTTGQKVLFGGAAVAGIAAGMGKGVRRDARQLAEMSGVPTSFLAQHSIRRAYGYKDSRIRADQGGQLGDLTLNLGNYSVLNKAIKR